MLEKLQALYRRYTMMIWVITGLVICYILAGFFLTPIVVSHLLEAKVSQIIGRKISAHKVYTNPFTFVLRLSDVAVADRDGSAFLDVRQIVVNAQPAASLFKWGMVVKSVVITEPGIRVVRTDENQFNFSDLMALGDREKKNDISVDGRSIRLILKNVGVEKGRVEVVDRAANSPFDSVLSFIDLTIDNLDTDQAAGSAQWQFSASTESEEKIAANGQLEIVPLDVIANVSVENLQIDKYASYYGALLNAQISEGTIDLAGRIQWSNDKQVVDGIQGVLTGLIVTCTSQDETLIQLPELNIVGAALDIKDKTVQFGSVTSRNGKISAVRNDQGQISLLTAFEPTSPKDTSSDGAAHETQTWVVHVPEVKMDDFSIQFQDAKVSPPADWKLTQIALHLNELSTLSDAKANVTLNLNWADQGVLSAVGEVGLNPFQTTLDVTAQNLDILPLQPYVNEHVKLVVQQGAFSTKGRMQVEPHDTALDLRFSGQAALNTFRSEDPKHSGDFLKWESLYLSGLEFSTTPFRLLINKVALNDFFNRLTIYKDGTSNLQAILGGNKRRDSTDAVALDDLTTPNDESIDQAPPNIRIDTVDLQGGKVDFRDLYIKPNVHLPMSAIGGRISGLDTIETHHADVQLQGRVNGNVPMNIKGQVNPLIPNPYVDLNLDFSSIDLSPFAPYSGKYLGYTLDKGQLSLNLSYRVADNKLIGRNKVLLNQLTLGESVPSSSATQLPIKFAISLLKDREGNIDLDLPVSGDLDNPEFSISGIVLKMFTNLIFDIVTSPFTMLSGIFGGGEELSYLDFEPGSGDLPASEKSKLDSLANILTERPGLNLEIQGQVDPETDRAGLRRSRFEQTLKAAKLKDLVAKGQSAIGLEQIALSSEERKTLIMKAYSTGKFLKPVDKKGKKKKLSPTEMEKLLYTTIDISDGDLRLLAHERASAAKNYLLETAGLEVRRLFVVEPEIQVSRQEESLQRRAKFNLK